MGLRIMKSRLTSMPSQDPLLDNFYEEVVEAGHAEEMDNPERGCGHLEHNAAYVRSDVQAFSTPDGEIPRFVELDPPVEFREYSGRGAIIPGYKAFPGVEFSLAYLNSADEADEPYTTRPAGELEDHIDRLRGDVLVGKHYGDMVPAQAVDLLMSVGETHWKEPEDYITECRKFGLNLRIPASPNKQPPIINPMRTRCWVVHPNAFPEKQKSAGIIGYSVLTRTVYTVGADATEEDPDIPTYAEEWADTGRISLVTPGEPIPEEEDSVQDQGLSEFAGGEDGE